MAAIQNLEFFRGEDVTLNFTMAPVVDITGWTLSFKAKASPTDAAILTVAGSVTVGASGTFSVSLTATQTTSLSAGLYVYDVWRTDSGAATALTMGQLSVKSTPRVP